MSAATAVTVRTTTQLESMRTNRDGSTLPAARYTSRDLWAAENATLWRQVWQWACREEDLPVPGSYAVYDILDQSVLVTRDAAGELHAFHNVCLHRGNRLRSKAGRGDEIACRYHSWTWNLDGANTSVTDREGFHNLDGACLGLKPVRFDTWEGFVFVTFDDDAEPLLDYLSPLAEKLGPYHFADQALTRSATMPVSANWKTIVDGFIEVYHLHSIHPQVIPWLDDVGTTYEEWGRHSAMYQPIGTASPRLADTSEQVVLDALVRPGSGYSGKMLRKSPHFSDQDDLASISEGFTVRQALIEGTRAHAAELGLDISGLTEAQLVDDDHYFLFPNVVFNVFAGHLIVARIRPDAVDHERSYFDMFVFDPRASQQRADRGPAPHADLTEGTPVGEVPDQDFTQLPSVQRGLHSDGFDTVLLSDQEIRVLAFHDAVDQYVFGPGRERDRP